MSSTPHSSGTAASKTSSSVAAAAPTPTKAVIKPADKITLKEPRVMLNRLRPEDEALMQKSLKAFAEKSPSLASKLGIVDNHRSGRQASNRKYRDDPSSDSSDEEPKRRSKFFKSKGKEKEIQRKKEKEERRSRPTDDDDDDYVPEADPSDHGSLRNRKRHRSVGAEPAAEEFTIRKKARKIERKLVPMIQKLSTEELMETNTYQRFNRSVEMIFDNTEDLDLNAELDEDADAPPEALIPKYQLQDLCGEAAKLKVLGATESIPPERLVRLLNILEKNIRDGAKVSPIADPDDGEEESKLWLELTMERVMRAVDSSLAALYILTSTNMPKRVYLEDVIDRIVLFTKYQLQNTIYPAFDPVYRIDTKSKDKMFTVGGSARKKRAHTKEVREKSILMLYNKLHEVVNLLSELLTIQVLTDTAVLHVSTLGVAPFFVEGVSELQLSSLKLVTTIFTRYEKHRRLLLDDILASIARLPSTKRSLRSYRLSSEENIQMLTALVLQLMQCVVALPDRLHHSSSSDAHSNSTQASENDKKTNNANNILFHAENNFQVDKDVLIVSKYDIAMQLAGNFLTVFLNKCGSKNEEIDYRPLFENFVQDLLTTVNKPEWPAAELLLSLLGKILVKNFMNKGTEMSLRVASLDYLGVVAARLRKDAVTSQLKVDTIDQISKEIQEEEQREADEAGQAVDSKKKKKEKVNLSPIEEEEERTQFLQRVLLDYLAVTGAGDQGYLYARHFYIVQWYRDAANEVSRPAKDAKRSTPKSHKKAKKGRKRKKGSDTEEESSEEEELDEDEEAEKKKAEDPVNSEVFRLVEKRKNFLMTKVKAIDDGSTGGRTVVQTYIEYESAELISRYLASKRPFSHSFDVYLIQILSVLNESSIAIRTKAMKCLTMVVEADPAVLGRTDMQMGVKHSFLDHSTSVREAAVDLVGKFVLSRPDLIDKYYDMLSQRILDTGVSVRKRVIKILKDICIECPEFTKIPEICVKMIRRVNDEEGIRKLVMEVFQNMWFTPVRERPSVDLQALRRKVTNITDVVAKCRDIGLDWFEQLLVSLFKPKEDKEDSTKVQVAPPRTLLTACKQIVDCLIETVLSLEENGIPETPGSQSQPTDVAEEPRNTSSQKLVACLTTLYLLAKIRPQLLVDHATTLQPYLSLKCKTQGDFQIISCVARTLELVVPLIEHPSESFMAQLEEDSVKLILQHERSVVASCLSCLGSVVNNVTRNFKLIRDCFKNYYGALSSYKQLHQKDPNDQRLKQYRAYFRRALFTVGLLMRHFDFNSSEVNEGLPPDIKNQVFETLMYFMHQPSDDFQYYTLQSIGSLCIRHYDFMLGPELKTLYHIFLTDEHVKVPLRTQVLNNIEIYLQEEERAKLSKKENLKEMGDISSGMASTVIQLYLREVLEAFLHPNVLVRKSALRVIQLILQQGLVHPVQIVPYLICMSTDVEQCVSHSADKQLQEIEKKYPGFIHMKTQDGIWLSYKLQHILQESNIVRGYRIKEGEMPTALNGFLYSILRNTKQQRRAITLSILKQFDEQVKTSLSQMMYLADNLAYFPYQVQDEPLFIIHHIDIVLSMSGTNLLQSFREALQLPGVQQENADGEGGTTILYDEEEEDDVEMLVSHIPDDILPLQECITASQGCMLLLVLKQHLKDLYGITDAKLTQYSPSESAKVYEKAVTRRSNSFFDPKGTIQKLNEGVFPEILDEDAKRDIITQYLNFKQLMLNFDPKDPDEDEEGNNGTQQTPQQRVQPNRALTNSNTPSAGDAGTSNQGATEQREIQPPKIPKLTIVPPRPPADAKHHHKSHKSHKSERHRKHKHRKKRRRVVVSDNDDEDESDYSDPDFLV
ncbi:hypothetical protein B566_EDAN001690 [Ephemera danica]|nr:hypothetical protein B566_EDAN001690 [Ephemera danica]